jgi:hypothetical protein
MDFQLFDRSGGLSCVSPRLQDRHQQESFVFPFTIPTTFSFLLVVRLFTNKILPIFLMMMMILCGLILTDSMNA